MRLVFFALAMLVAAVSAVAVPQALTISPAEPYNIDPLELHVDVILPTPCYEIEAQVVYVTGEVLHVDYEIRDPGLYDCIQVLAEGEFDLIHDPLPTGHYQVVVHERQFYGSVQTGESYLYAELNVGCVLPDEELAWGAVKASYR